MMLIELKFGTPLFVKRTKAITKQIPQSMAFALTMTAYDTRDQLREDLPKHFTIRSKWVSKGIRVKPTRANKRDLTIEIGSVDPFMRRQAYGGVKTGIGGKMIAIPLQTIRKRKTQKVLKSRWPSSLKRKSIDKNGAAGYFYRPLPSGDIGFFKRNDGKWRYDKEGFAWWVEGKPPPLLYVLRRTLKVEKRWPFDHQVWSVVRKQWRKNQSRGFEKALKTAR